MINYVIRKTDITEPTITVSNDTVIEDVMDIALIGQMKTNYGTNVNENFLNILENFACPELANSELSDNIMPDLSETSKEQLKRPIIGQFWYNSTKKLIFFWDGAAWKRVPNRGQYAANWGMVYHNEVLPKPVSVDGRVFEYDECIWSVSPSTINGSPDTFNCNTDNNALVTMQYRYAGTETFVDGIANYLIIGIDNNSNNGFPYITPVIVSPTPTPSPSLTPSVTMTVTPSKTPASTPTSTPTSTPVPTVTRTPVVSPTSAPTGTPASTPAPTPSVTPSSTPPTYCWNISQVCVGFTGYREATGERLGFTTLFSSSPPQTATGACQSVTNVVAPVYGRISWLLNYARYCNPAVRVKFNTIDSNGVVTSHESVLTLPMTASSFAKGIVNGTYVVNGVTKTITANITWNKSDGNSHGALGTLSAIIDFPDIRGRC